MMIAAFVNQIIQLRYGRLDESESDEWGLRLMEEAKLNPQAMIHVMEVLKSAGPRGNTPALFQSHPNPDLRIKQIEAYLRKNPPSPGLSNGRSLLELYQAQ
jgi:predicted Zn-dependent protease